MYLQAPTDVLIRRVQERARRDPEQHAPSEDYLAELNEAYQHFFFHYTASPLLVVETSQMDVSWGDETVADLLRQLGAMGGGTQYYVPRTG
jgi:deoxyadenosine/deoxycytidine kinase